jgi:hypothetical protein
MLVLPEQTSAVAADAIGQDILEEVQNIWADFYDAEEP